MPDARSLAASRSADASRALTSALRLVGRAMTSARAMAIAWLCPATASQGGCLTTRPRGLGGLVVRGLGGLPDNPSHWKMMMKM